MGGLTCPDCGEDFPESILYRHREYVHPEEFAAAGSAAAAEARAVQAAQAEDDRYLPGGFLRRTGTKRDTKPTDNASLLGSVFPPEPGPVPPPWERERGPE